MNHQPNITLEPTSPALADRLFAIVHAAVQNYSDTSIRDADIEIAVHQIEDALVDTGIATVAVKHPDFVIADHESLFRGWRD